MAALSMLALAPGSAHAAPKDFSLDVKPGSVGQHTTVDFTVTVTNTSTDGHKMGSVNLLAPAKFTITGVGDPSSGTKEVEGNLVKLRYLSLTGGKSVTIVVTARTAEFEGRYPWTATAKGSQTYAEKDTPWGERTASTTVDSTNSSERNCPGGQACSLTQRHTVSAAWVAALMERGGGGASATGGGPGLLSDGFEPPSPYWVQTTVETHGAGPLTLRYLNPETESVLNDGSGCNGGLDGDPLRFPPYVEPSDAAALYDGPDAKKTVQYEISAELWALAEAAGGQLDACFSAPFVFATKVLDPPFLAGTTTWFNGLLADCVGDPAQRTGVCIDRSASSEPDPQTAGDPATVSIELNPPFVGGTDPMSR